MRNHNDWTTPEVVYRGVIGLWAHFAVIVSGARRSGSYTIIREDKCLKRHDNPRDSMNALRRLKRMVVSEF